MAVREGRKMLPPIPTMPEVTQQATADGAAPAEEKLTPGSKTLNELSKCTQEYALMAEFNLLSQQKLPGVYVVPSALNPFEKVFADVGVEVFNYRGIYTGSAIWNGILFVRKGMYQGGIFRFVLKVSETYPNCDSPTLFFIPPLFHPIVHPETGELDVKRAFPKWRKNVNHLWQVLLYARRIFYKIDTKTPWNPEAAVLYDQIDLYESKVAETVKLCKEKLYELPDTDDVHAIRFTQWDPSIHDGIRKAIIKSKSPQEKASSHTDGSTGLSWMLPDNPQIFSKEDMSPS